MKYFFFRVTCQYDGLEWGTSGVCKGKSLETATKRINKIDFTHQDGTERQYVADLREITELEYGVLSEFLLIC